MSFFETPSWDGDLKVDKLAAELFSPLNVPLLKLSKRRKKSKPLKGSSADEVPKTIKSLKEAKIALSKKNVSCTKLLKCRNEGQAKSIGNPMVKKKCDSSVSSSVENAFSLSTSASGSTLSSNLPVKCKKRKKKCKSVNMEGDIEKVKGAHKLKSLQGKLDLNLKNSHKESCEGGSITNEELKHKRDGRQTNCTLSHTVKNRKNGSVNLNCEQQPIGRPNQLIGKESEKCLVPKKEMKESSHESINPRKRKWSPSGESHNTQSSADSSMNDIVTDGNKSNLLKNKLKKGLRDKEIIANNGKNGQKRIKKPKSSEIGSQADELVISSVNTVGQLGREHDHVNRLKDTSSLEIKGAIVASPKKKLTLREKMMEKLRGSRFRFMNEQLYTSKSEETRKFFESDTESFEAYHEGYKQQLLLWPVKPVDLIIKYLKKKPSNYIIADFGCGDAQIAQSLPNKVHSFDFVALNDRVTACDMAHTPLTKGSVDVAVFCLSLMGSNLSDYIYEANRVLKIGGILKIAEVESRFDSVEKFIRVICKFGFLCINRDLSRDVFYLFDFKKEKNLKEEKVLPRIELRPCTYKKR